MSDFETKMHQNLILAGTLPRPCWESLQRSPGPSAGFKVATPKGRGVERNGWDGIGVEGTGGDGRECCGVQKLP